MIEQLQQIYNNITGRTDIVLTPKTRIDENIGVSSFTKIQLICAVEDAFDIEVPNVELKRLKTVQNLMDLIETLCS